ncbi:MAG: penicillin-binding protein 2 [Acidimicrobiales bacterium]
MTRTPGRPRAGGLVRSTSVGSISFLARLRHPLRGTHLYPKPRKARPSKTSGPRGPRMRPRRSIVDRVVPGEPSPARTVVRLRVLGAIVIVLFSLMFVRLWYLQVLGTKGFAQAVTQNQVREVEVPAPRGLILDRSGNIMADNQVTRDITLSRLSAEQHPEVVGRLAALLGVSPTQIQSDLSNTQYSLYKPVPVLENAPISDVLYIGEHSAQFPGVSATADTTRTYPMGQTGVQMLGYLGGITSDELSAHKSQGYQLGDLYGQSGLENQYQSALRGTPGTQRVEVDAQGQVVGSLGQTQPSSGEDLVTNIDGGLEQTLQQALDSEIASLPGSSGGGAAVALNPQTGAVLALVSSPTYDPTWWEPEMTNAHYAQLTNPSSHYPLNDRAIDGLYIPGSTFKLATATAALNDGLITPGYIYDDTGRYTIPGCKTNGSGCATYTDNEGEIGGPVNVTKALTISSDIFFYNLGVTFWDDYKANGQYGETPIQDAANALGYGEVTGIDVPGETHDARVDSPQVVAREHAQNPVAYPNSGWFTGNNLELAFGQGGTVITPLEQAVAYATFANGGTRYTPEIGAGLVDPVTHRVVQRFAPKISGHVSYSPANYLAMLQGFEGAVQSPSGTAYAAFQGFPLSSFPLAGKTGTATVQEQHQPNSWFVGWGPLPTPQYLIAVVVEGGGYGSQAAAPVVRQGFDYLVAHPEAQTQLAAPPSAQSAAFTCRPSVPSVTSTASVTSATAAASQTGLSSITAELPCTAPGSTVPGSSAPDSTVPGRLTVSSSRAASRDPSAYAGLRAGADVAVHRSRTVAARGP